MAWRFRGHLGISYLFRLSRCRHDMTDPEAWQGELLESDLELMQEITIL